MAQPGPACGRREKARALRLDPPARGGPTLGLWARNRRPAAVAAEEERHHEYARGHPAAPEAMLTEPLVINYYDEVFYSPGVAASPSVPAAGA
jgi:hypothetical protein